MDNKGKSLATVIAKAIFYASIQASIGSVEMSSKFSVMNFSKDQETLQRAADALRSYLIIGVIWTIGTILALYAAYGWKGGWIGFVANAIMMAWIIVSYNNSFREASRRYDLEMPQVFKKNDWIYLIILIIVLVPSILYINQC